MQQTFLDIVYKIFYDTAQRDFKDVRLLLSEKYQYPSIQFDPNIEVKIPIPKKSENGITYSGYFFADSFEDQTTAWGLFLASVYHLASHVAVSNYSLYEKWIQNKTPKNFWKVIDFIEDDAVERYLSTTNPDIWDNILQINVKSPKKIINKNETQYAQKFASKLLDSIKQEMSEEILQCFDKEHQENVLGWASKLYQHHQILNTEPPFYQEQHHSNQSIVFQRNKFEFYPSGKFENTIKKL